MLMKEISQSIAAFASDAPTMDQLMSALRFERMHHSEDQRWVALEFVAGLVSENATRAFFPDDLPIVMFDPEENLVDVLQRCVELADPAQFDDLSAKHEASMTCQGLEEMIGVAKELD